MSEVEEKSQNFESVSEVELPSKEEMDLVAPSVGLYVCAFSKKPFSEAWSVDGEEIGGLLLNPRTAGELVKQLYDPNQSTIKRSAAFQEKSQVKKDVVLEHVDKTLKDPMTSYLCRENWFSKEDFAQLKNLQENLSISKDNYCEIEFLYPLTMAVDSYREILGASRDLLLLGYQSDETFDENSEVKFINVNTELEIPEEMVYPRVLGRFLSANHPDLEGGIGADELAIKETKYYLNKEEQEELRNAVDSDRYTIFLGEVAKIPDNKVGFNAMFLAGAKYMEVLMQPSETKTDLNHPIDYIPEQVLYMSLPGTAVTNESRMYKGNSRLYQSLSVFWKPFGLNYEENILSFTKPDGEVVLFGIIKRI